MKIFIIFYFILSFTSAIIGQNYKVGDTLTVVALNGLNLRATSSATGEKIGKIDNGIKVIILKVDSLPAERIDQFTGNWVLVSTLQGTKGYVFDAYISSFPIVNEMKIFNQFISFNNKISNPNDTEKAPELLREYCEKVFKKSSCELKYYNGSDGEGSHTLEIIELEHDHKLILHQYWESNSTELELYDARISEIYYLVLNLMKFYPDEGYQLNDKDLLNPTYSNYPCAVINVNQFCIVKIVMKGKNRISIFFRNQGT